MTRRSKIWLAVAALFIAINVAGAVVAAAAGEVRHTGVHVGLLLIGALAVRWLLPGRAARAVPRELADRLTYLEQALDAVAIEVERIGEGQRFITRVLADNAPPQAAGQGTRKPSEVGAREAAPHDRGR